jgi:uncharacterized sulfatase
VFIAAASLCAQALGAADAPPNVVLIISDDHGWTDYGFMGHPRIRTPNLDWLASQSLTFRRGYVPSSLCCPSLASVITGLYAHQHKVTSNDPPIPAGMKPEEFSRSSAFTQGREVMNRHLEAVPTLPRLLARRGYLSLQTGKWWQGDYTRGGFTHGMTKGQRHGDVGLEIGRKTMQPIDEFIKTAKQENRPFLVWYAPMLPHAPHNPPERLLARYREQSPSLHVARYWAMVDWFDETCGQLLDLLERHGVAENTLVVYLADNGWIQDPNGSGPIRSKTTPYDGGIRTPIMVRWPARVKPRASDELAMSIDIAPTVLAAVGIDPTPAMQGRNLLDDAAVRSRKVIEGACFTHNAVDLNDPAKNVLWRWLIAGRWKLIVPAAAGGRAELYDILADPTEKSDRAGGMPELVQELRRKLDDWWRPGS